MHLDSLADLPPAAFQAVIINVNTRAVATLALLSALRYAGMPVLLIDCESTDGSWAHFSALMEQHRFDMLSAPLKAHGDTLNWLFQHIPARRVLLIDSDLELLDAELVRQMCAASQGARAMGSGSIQRGVWMTAQRQPFAWYEERPWVPLTLLDVAAMREALASGLSFRARVELNEFPPSPLISRLLIKRFRVPLARRLRLAWLDVFRRDFGGRKPAYVMYDTAAEIYQHLLGRGYTFADLSAAFDPLPVRHYHGVTRLLLNARDHNGASLAQIAPEIDARLRDEYGVVC